MFASAIHATGATGEGRCQRGEESQLGQYNLPAFLHAMTARGGGGHGGGRGRHRRHGFGPGGEGGYGFGAFPPGGGPFGRGRKARRGDIRTAALLLLAEEPRNGYQIMQEIQERSEGVWRPSPGSVYPTLQQLEDEGLIRSEETDGRKLLQLTDAGRAYVEERGESEPAPWEQMSGDVSDEAFQLRRLIREVWFAFVQVMRTGSEAQLKQAHTVLAAARRDLYRILADGDPDGPGESAISQDDA
jgi:DNA-binding PadR family transcriptional regulator